MNRLFIALAAFFGLQNFAWGGVPVPPDLSPGDKYHLAFSTIEVRTATAGDIASYDSFVQMIADSAGIGGNITWRAIASTAAVNARDHAVIGNNTPVYNMNLQKVANGYSDFWDGSHSANIAWAATGAFVDNDVWTGTLQNGLKEEGQFLGGASAWCGVTTALNAEWTSNITVSTTTILSIYALSQELSVPNNAGIAINAGHSGNWWGGLALSGEGAQIEVSDGRDGKLVFVVSFYSYSPSGGQIFLVGVGTPNGDTVDVDVFITEGAVWGDGFDPDDVVESEWGTGTFTAESCELIHMTLTPNLAYLTEGYTAIAYDLIRLTTPIIACPYGA